MGAISLIAFIVAGVYFMDLAATYRSVSLIKERNGEPHLDIRNDPERILAYRISHDKIVVNSAFRSLEFYEMTHDADLRVPDRATAQHSVLTHGFGARRLHPFSLLNSICCESESVPEEHWRSSDLFKIALTEYPHLFEVFLCCDC